MCSACMASWRLSWPSAPPPVTCPSCQGTGQMRTTHYGAVSDVPTDRQDTDRLDSVEMLAFQSAQFVVLTRTGGRRARHVHHIHSIARLRRHAPVYPIPRHTAACGNRAPLRLP